MTLQDQVTSLELSKRLKELGVKQYESLYSWVYSDESLWVGLTEMGRFGEDVGFIASAFTVAELGELLGHDAKSGMMEYLTQYRAYHAGIASHINDFDADTEADARGMLLIHLLENSLI